MIGSLLCPSSNVRENIEHLMCNLNLYTSKDLHNDQIIFVRECSHLGLQHALGPWPNAAAASRAANVLLTFFAIRWSHRFFFCTSVCYVWCVFRLLCVRHTHYLICASFHSSWHPPEVAHSAYPEAKFCSFLWRENSLSHSLSPSLSLTFRQNSIAFR